MTMTKEKCDRCGEVGEDRRTLWHACLYEMGELGLPFEQVCLEGVRLKQTGAKTLEAFRVEVPVFEEATPEHTTDKRAFYTLRVCKACRSSWLFAIELWFKSVPDLKESCGSGIFVRKNGATVEITREEWGRLYADREPVTVKP